MNELELSHKIKERLDEGLALAPETLERLRAARERALSRQRAAVSAGALVANGPGTVARTGGWLHALTHYVVPALMLAAALFGLNAWQQAQREALLAVDPQAAEIAAIDAAVLKSDLPLDAYLDKGFQAWLQGLAASGEDSRSPQ